VCLSGELSQSERTHALQAMRDGRAQVCVATDVAARGIDLPGLDLVIHADLPMNAEALLHRSGRTGRAGRKGVSVLIVPSRQVNKAERLLKFGKITAEWVAAPTADDVRRRDEERLLADAAWSDAPSEEEAAFAARLSALHSPETLAVACLRLFNARLSAPEDLGKPAAPRAPRAERPDREDRPERGERPERAERAERAPFGPSQWIALSVGRAEGAEPRWLLPMLCRVGGLSKEQIGAIRMQQDETHVELTADSVAGFLSRLGEGSVLEGEITVRTMDSAPPASPRPPRDDSPRPVRPARDFDSPRPPRPARDLDGPRPARPRDDSPRPARPARDFDAPRPARPARDFDAARPARPRDDSPRPARAFDPARPPRDFDSPRPPRDRDEGPRKPRTKSDGAPKRAAARLDAPRGAVKDSASRPPKPRYDDAAPARKTAWDKPAPQGERPRSAAPKPDETPHRAGAADPSKRFERPGKPLSKPGGKPGGKPFGKSDGPRGAAPKGRKPGGDAPPRKPFGKRP